MKIVLKYTNNSYDKNFIKNIKTDIKYTNNPTYFIENIIFRKNKVEIFVGDSDYENSILSLKSETVPPSHNLGGGIIIKTKDNKYLLTIRGGQVSFGHGMVNISAGGAFQPDSNNSIKDPMFINKSILKEVEEELSPEIAKSLSLTFLGIIYDENRRNKPDICFHGQSNLTSNQITNLINNNKNREIEFLRFFFIEEKLLLKKKLNYKNVILVEKFIDLIKKNKLY